MWGGGGGRRVGGGWEKLKVSIAGGGWLLNCFFLSFSDHENYSIKNICVFSKSKIKTEVTSKLNLEHFKMINRRFFINKLCKIQKCCCHPPEQYSLEGLCFCFHQGPTFLRLSTCVFRFC